MRILLVEDERKVAEMVSRGLKAERYAVDVAENGGAGWAMAEATKYDLVILDLGLPGMDGSEVLRRIRAHDLRTPILVLTARDATSSKVENFEAGADKTLRIRRAGRPHQGAAAPRPGEPGERRAGRRP
jgi:DNA-binding response OmpR family regulator